MKAELTEFEGCFNVTLIAENLKDAVEILRCGMNHTKELRYLAADVEGWDYKYNAANESRIQLNITFGKRKAASSHVPQVDK